MIKIYINFCCCFNRVLSPVLTNFLEYLFLKTENNKTQTASFKLKFSDGLKELLKNQTNEHKAAVSDWKKKEKDSKELLENYEKVSK